RQLRAAEQCSSRGRLADAVEIIRKRDSPVPRGRLRERQSVGHWPCSGRIRRPRYQYSVDELGIGGRRHQRSRHPTRVGDIAGAKQVFDEAPRGDRIIWGELVQIELHSSEVPPVVAATVESRQATQRRPVVGKGL